MAKKEDSKRNKPFKVQGWKEKSDEPVKTDLTFEELIKLSVSESNKKGNSKFDKEN